MQDPLSAKSSFHQMIGEICQENHLSIVWLSADWFGILERDGVERHILGYGKLDLNPAAASMAADDKYVTFEVLSRAKVPVIQHAILYEATNQAPYVKGRNSLDYLTSFFNQYQQNIVIKPNNGQCGKNVYHLTTLAQVPSILEKVFRQSLSASLCPFYPIQHEYRVIMLDDEARLIYQKNRQTDWRFNLSNGATASQVTDERLKRELVNLARQAMRAIGLRFCSVDIILTETNGLLVMEINSGVATSHYLEQFPEDYTNVKSIYRDAILRMFADV